jgi:hypothetical protein
MTEWWEKAYPGGKMVPVPGFPRSLYPPDAAEHGKRPSVDGPDVVAFKRTVSRAGRWPWSSDFNDSYTDEFAHGRAGGNVPETGVAGVQRQSKIDDTGWIGEKTFNLLRSIKIPEGLPHAGEMAMDAKAQSLLVEAWEMFEGEEPEEPSKTSVRQAAHDLAVDQLGVKESPPNSNNTPYNDWYGMDGPWCAMFVSWCYEHAGPSFSFAKGQSYAYVPYIVSDARAKRNGLSLTSSPVAGDVVCFDWEGDGVHDHTGLFSRWTGGGSFECIEGNTAVDNNSDGGEVMRRSRSQSGVLFVRVAE